MKCTFYRPEKVDVREFARIVDRLRDDLHELETRPCDESTVYAYIQTLSQLAKPLPHNPLMTFWGLWDPHDMPHDARVDFFYQPTYLATAFLIKSVLLFPSLLDSQRFPIKEQSLEQLLKSALLACTGRNFNGAGVLTLKECVEIFEGAGATEFLNKYPALSPDFKKLFEERKSLVDKGMGDPSGWFY